MATHDPKPNSHPWATSPWSTSSTYSSSTSTSGTFPPPYPPAPGVSTGGTVPPNSVPPPPPPGGGSYGVYTPSPTSPSPFIYRDPVDELNEKLGLLIERLDAIEDMVKDRLQSMEERIEFVEDDLYREG